MRRTRTVLALFLVLTFAASAAEAQGVDKPLPDPTQESRARALFKDLRCLVCQNQSIDDSNADLARDLRNIVRERINAGDSDEQAVDFLVARYGDWVLLQPPFKAGTLVLWLGPLGILLLAGGVTLTYLRRQRRPAAGPAALSDAERRRLEALLEED
ncbi:MAG: cytochrome c-type biogenesis protein CcmH [Alphaproteobacteria bacterium]|jgi:cytochrome c-type biogenesis protein CcmH|nr:cytochrome C biogenesis protein CcmH [Rhodospirillaceae bacterium]MDP6407027.1 cytochrome c-type biogenesis protein CcmH [Alphaproteobacteria bacterium]MDP6620935.1 cytochrome c-type biogenesis protein CcmH [Alphaproteobacteria bacterium]|tara:strand:+ start:155 stop:625 length:471 start_codon:yes stop_codon:yes gene_type:complete